MLLSVLDRKWREHLYEMDYLQEGIDLRAMAQRDPLVEYQREGFDMFNAMLDGIKEESVGFLFNLEVQVQAPPAPVLDLQKTVASGPGEAPGEVVSEAGLPEGQPQPGAELEPGEVGGQLPDDFGRPERPADLQYTAPTAEGGVQTTRPAPVLDGVARGDGEQSRNALCSCGSGKKFKRCHGAPGSSA